MTERLNKAMEIEQIYLAHRMKGEEPFHLVDKIIELGYSSLEEYFKEKGEYKFSQWIPEVYRIDVSEFSAAVEDAILHEKYGIYIPVADGLYAYHGTDDIDYALCSELGVRVIELNYTGGTIVGSSEDLSIEIVMPNSIGFDSRIINNKILEIVSAYVNGVSISGNDLLLNGEKVMGSMTRYVGNTFVWAAQISFGEYYDIIQQVCNKESVKKPSHIPSDKITRVQLESEVLKWLLKQ